MLRELTYNIYDICENTVNIGKIDIADKLKNILKNIDNQIHNFLLLLDDFAVNYSDYRENAVNVFVINVIGAFIHSARLQFVEFFGKFYEDGGDAFAPLKKNTKYINRKQDVNL